MRRSGRRAAGIALGLVAVVGLIALASGGLVGFNTLQVVCLAGSGAIIAGAFVLLSLNISEAKLRFIISRAALSIGSIIFTLLIIEGAARIYALIHPVYRTAEEFRRTQPLPYQGASYFSQEFISESFKQPGGWTMPKGTILILPNDFDGKFFHVKDGKRATVDQPTDYAHTVYVFGGSTVYCSEVPDAYTLPSELQKLLAQAYGSQYRVENYGTTSVNTTQQVARLKTVKIQPGDIVVFYDGVNDVYLSLYYRQPHGSLALNALTSYQSLNPLQRFLFDTYGGFHNYSAAVELFLYPFVLKPPEQVENKTELAALTDAMTAQYKSNIQDAYQYTTASGGTFYHFVQPQIFTLASHSPYEASLIHNPYIVPPGSETVFIQGYPALRAASGELAKQGIFSSDISTALDGSRREGKDYFLDYTHVNDVANAIIAQAIFDQAFKPAQ